MSRLERAFLYAVVGGGAATLGFLAYLMLRVPKQGTEDWVITANALAPLVVIISIGALIGFLAGGLAHKSKSDDQDDLE